MTTTRQRDDANASRLAMRLEALLAHFPLIVFECDRHGILTVSEGKGLIPMGLKPGEAIGRSVFDLYRDEPKIIANIHRALAGEAFTSVVNAAAARYEVHYDPIWEDGQVIGVCGVAMDITESQRLAHEAGRDATFLDSIVENLPDMIFVKDAENLSFVRFNRAGEELLGYRRDQLLGKTDYDFFPREEADFFTSEDRKVLARGEVVRIPEEPIHTRLGSRFLDTKKIPIRDDTGRPRYLLGISRDITDFKRAQEELQLLNARLQELDQLKNRFFANVSHELRTPLTLVLGLTDRTLEDPGLSEMHRRDLAAIERNARMLLKQVNDILDLTKLEAGKMTIDYAALDLASVVALVASPFDVLASERHITYVLDVPASLPAQLDVEKVERILANLLSNAFKFTPDGGYIRCRLHAHDQTAVLTVSDSGPGVPVESRTAIFERFVQVDGDVEYPRGGTGLGLAIAKEFIVLHEGTISVGDAPEGGALFAVTLPLLAPFGTAVREAPAALVPHALVASSDSSQHAIEALRERERALSASLPAERALVLLVEDNLEMSSFIAEILGREFRIALAFDGQEGLDLVLALRPDLILTDIMMPRLNGEQLVRAMRARRELDGIPIVLLTAKADDELRVRLLREGAQDYLAKPFVKGELLARVGNLVTMKRTRDILQQELATHTHDLEMLAGNLAQRKRELQTALDSVSVAREQAERCSQLRTNFLRLVSHEICTPLTIQQLHLRNLTTSRDIPLAPKQAECVKKIASAGNRLLDLVNMILEYARVESGKLPVHLEPMDLAALAKDVCQELQPQADHKGLKVEVSADAGLLILESDPKLVRLILINLIGNAIKFTERGHVEVTLSDGAGQHCMIVRDTGPGIPPDKLGHIFEPFEHLEPTTHKHTPGFGLGLALVKDMVGALGGTIDVTSCLGAGSTFTVRVPSIARK